VAVWGDSLNIVMRVFNADGTPKGREVAITLTAGEGKIDGMKFQPAVTALSNGNFVIVWEDGSESEGEVGVGLRGQIFSADGVAVEPDFHVNSTVSSNQLEVAVTALTNGGFAVAFTDVSGDADGSAARTTVFDSTGTALARDQIANATTKGAQATLQ
jgi:hypothetical protein